MSTLEFLSYLRSLDIKVWPEGDKLRFRAPDSALTPTLRAELHDRKAEILAFLTRVTDDAVADAPPIDPCPREGSHPLSFSQERLWFLDQLDPGSPAYNIHSATRFQGALNVVALEQSLNEMVRRHESLRTTFSIIDGKPVQVIAPEASFCLPIIDLSDLSEADRHGEAERLATAEAQRPFDLSAGPLLRVHIILLKHDDLLWVENIHHIISDDWSMKIFTREVAELYSAFSQGEQAALPDLPIQYVDYTHWQREWLQGEILESQVDYWKKQLGGTLPVLQLPTDRPRPASQTYRGTHATFLIPARLYHSLKAASDKEGVTLFMMILAAFNTLLCRYSGQDDVIVGSPIAGRNQVETENIIGYFLNTLVLRTDLSGNPTFRQLLSRVREVCLGAYAHQEIPFEPLLEKLRIKRDLSRTPLFQTMLVLLNTPVSSPRPTAETMGLTISPIKIDNGTTKFDLSLSMTETEQGIESVLDYNLDLFDPPTINRMIGHFIKLLEGITVNLDEHISDLPLMSETEESQLLSAWNDTRTPYSEGLCLHHLFEAQAERGPEAVAVVCQDDHLSYRELNERANQLAHYLGTLGLGPESCIGILMDRSLELLVSILGILKAGAAYVPLDPVYSKERISFILQDAQIPVLLTQQHLVPHLPEHDALTICLDPEWKAIADQSVSNPRGGAEPESVAILLYTSGSTGKPKGSMLSHKGLVNYTEAANIAYALSAEDQVLQFGSISFDLSAEEIFPCLSCGATLVLRTDSMLDSAAAFLRKCDEWSITVLDLPTLYWHELTVRISLEVLSLPPSLRLVIIGGEKALPEQVSLWHRQAGRQVKLVNTYGPTEATIAATRCELSPPDVDKEPGDVPIGRAISNVQIYVLDEGLKPVPVGVFGELHIGGVGLARGYLDRADLTAEKFIPNPFSSEGGLRLYRTGDVAKYRPDGNLEYIGRRDRQVKMRGFRIELGEIESALNQHPDIQEAFVVAHEDETAQKRLIAYAVCRQVDDGGLTTTALRRFLRARLPNYMIPAAFIFLEQLPLNSNGKVDQRALPLPDRSRPEMEEGYVAPRTPTEEVLAGIWLELLTLEQVGVYDNFFELGGHSLMATQIISRVREALHVEISLRSFFESPNISELAQAIEMSERTDQSEVDEILRTLDSIEDLSATEVEAMLMDLQGSQAQL